MSNIHDNQVHPVHEDHHPQDPVHLLSSQLAQLTSLVGQVISTNGNNQATGPTLASLARDLGKAFQKPPEFDGKDRKACTSFISHLNLYINANPHLFPDDRAKVLFAASYLRGQAFTWFEPHLLRADDPLVSNYAAFTQDLIKNLGDPDRERSLTRELQGLSQTQSCAAYTTKFYSISSQLEWGDKALMAQYYSGLKPKVKDALAYLDRDFVTLKDLSDTAIRLDNRLFERDQDGKRSTTAPHKPSSGGPRPAQSNRPTGNPSNNGPAPMDLDAARNRPAYKPLTPEERQRRLQNKLCLYCGEANHQAANCPNKKSKAKRINATLDSDSVLEIGETKNE